MSFKEVKKSLKSDGFYQRARSVPMNSNISQYLTQNWKSLRFK